MKKSWIFTVAALLFMGCDDSGEEQNPTACDNGKTQCTATGQIQTCVNGAWSLAVNCPVSQICMGTMCVPSQPSMCIPGQTQCTATGQIQTCVNGAWGLAVDCPAEQTCAGTACVPKTPSQQTCEDGKTQCTASGQIQVCVQNAWSAPANCDAGLSCVGTACVAQSSSSTLTCGSTVCQNGQLCKNGQCIDRNNKKSQEGQPCKPSEFLESCDGNVLVFCQVDSSGEVPDQVATLDCGNDSFCALDFKSNLGNCIHTDPKCNASTAGEFTLCFDNGISYLDYRNCALAADGKYYPFRDEVKTEDCVGACIDSYSCNAVEHPEKCTKAENYCQGNIVVFCYDDLSSYKMNCEDYGTTCRNGDCVWE